MPLAGELTASLISRVAAGYGLAAGSVLRLWTCRNSPVRHDGGGVRADAEVVLNEAGRGALAELCGVEAAVLARALPAFTVDDPKISTGREAALAQARWRAAGTVAGEAAFGCRLCTARRTGQALRAVRAGVEPEQAFAVAHAVVARWWEQALYWEQEKVWPWRLHQLAGGRVGSRLEWWRIVGQDAAIFPEVAAVAQALLEPAMAELAWRASGGMRPRARGDDDVFCHRLGERVGRTWLGPELAADHRSPLNDFTGVIVRARREAGPPGWGDPWRLKREQQPATPPH